MRKPLPADSNPSGSDTGARRDSFNAAAPEPDAVEVDWDRLRRFANSWIPFYVVCFADSEGNPHAVPIGSLRWNRRGHGFFFQVFARRLDEARDGRVCIVGLDANPWHWARAFLTGAFRQPPGLRVHARLGPVRPASKAELDWWRRRTLLLRPFRGARLLWGDMRRVRDIEVLAVDPLRIGAMTRGARY
ncbi:MAG: hypothetical protein SF028_15710 [Candidatus Sumerlaeia bacterium]|nr:hypothetical protein [Candidatus Sumerlaeia bacterium]